MSHVDICRCTCKALQDLVRALPDACWHSAGEAALPSRHPLFSSSGALGYLQQQGRLHATLSSGDAAAWSEEAPDLYTGYPAALSSDCTSLATVKRSTLILESTIGVGSLTRLSLPPRSKAVHQFLPVWGPDAHGCALLTAQPGKRGQLALQLLLAAWNPGAVPQRVVTVALDQIAEADVDAQRVLWAPSGSGLAVRQGTHQLDDNSLAQITLYSARGQLLGCFKDVLSRWWAWSPCATQLACGGRLHGGVELTLLSVDPTGRARLGPECNLAPYGCAGLVWAACSEQPLLVLLPCYAHARASLELVSCLPEGPAFVRLQAVELSYISEPGDFAAGLTHCAAECAQGVLVLRPEHHGPRPSFSMQHYVILPHGYSKGAGMEFDPTGAYLACAGIDLAAQVSWLHIVRVSTGQVLASRTGPAIFPDILDRAGGVLWTAISWGNGRLLVRTRTCVGYHASLYRLAV